MHTRYPKGEFIRHIANGLRDQWPPKVPPVVIVSALPVLVIDGADIGPIAVSTLLICCMLVWVIRASQFSRLLSADGLICLGGVLIWFSIFLPYSYGPMGGALRQSALMRNIDVSWMGLALIVTLLPGLFGPFGVMSGFVGMILGESKRGGLIRYIGIIVWVGSLLIGRVCIAIVFGHSEATVISAAIEAIIGCAALCGVTCLRDQRQKLGAVHVLAVLLALRVLLPGASLSSLGSGFWLLCLGHAIILSAAAIQLMRRGKER